MKKQLMRVRNTTIYSKFTKIAVAAFILVSSFSANAQTSFVSNTKDPITTAAVNHVGTIDDMMLFRVQYGNNAAERFSVIIKDQEGTVLFNEIYNDKNFDKRFKLPKEEYGKVTFYIRGTKSGLQTFEVNTNTKIVQEVTIKKLG